MALRATGASVWLLRPIEELDGDPAGEIALGALAGDVDPPAVAVVKGGVAEDGAALDAAAALADARVAGDGDDGAVLELADEVGVGAGGGAGV